MNPTTTPKAGAVADVAAKLTEAQRLDLTERWDQFCDCDPLSGNRDHEEYRADMLLDGFADLRAVDDDDLEDPFAWDRGIVPGGEVYTLTPLGLTLRQHLEQGATAGVVGGKERE